MQIFQRRIASAGFAVVSALGSTPASARDITFAIIGPQEYNLPADGFKPFDALVQYVEYDNSARRFDDRGNEVAGPDQTLVVGLTKYVRFWTFKGLPDVGFAWEYIQPEVRLTGPGLKASGFGDPLTGFAMWIKPTGNTTAGVQTFASIPIGASEVTNNYWANLSSVFFDWQGKRLAFTGDLGVVLRGTRNDGRLPIVDEGDSVHANGRLSVKTGTRLEPFASIDWQRNARSRIGDTVVALSSGSDTALGAGVLVGLGDRFSVTARYARSVAGRNVPITDAAYFKLAAVF
ncbi:transporter [Sphingomonas sp. VNH70]|uniref:transporter n=1 Tax=Sphingomonas silueang TaxID=3156617 RepID=UPI0032B49AF4